MSHSLSERERVRDTRNLDRLRTRLDLHKLEVDWMTDCAAHNNTFVNSAKLMGRRISAQESHSEYHNDFFSHVIPFPQCQGHSAG